MKFPAFALATLLALVLPAFSQTPTEKGNPADDYEARQFASADGHKLNYRLLKPLKYDATKKYPLVVFLHGSGERGDDNVSQLRHGAPAFSKPEVREKYEAFVIAPQCPAEQKWADIDWSSDTPTQPAALSASMALTLSAVEGLQKEFSIDADRLYVTGLSMGGYGTWDLVTRLPAMWAAAAPICGGGDKAKAVLAKAVPIWAFHGAEDKTVKPIRTVEMIDAIIAAGGHPLFSEYPYIAHDSWTTAYGEPEFLPWLFAQRRGQPMVAFEKVAGPHAQPPSNQAPGAGPMQSGLWFRKLWQSRRADWDKSKEADQGAVVFFGDSITQGWGSLAKDFPTLKVANRGISGDTTRGLLARIQGDVLDLHPRAVSLLIGTNDLDQGATPETVAANMKAIVAMLHKADPKMPVIINKVMPRGPKQDRNFAELIPKLNRLYEEAFKGDSRVTFFDSYALFVNAEQSVNKDEFPDLLHPNAAGYAKWTAGLRPIFEKLKLAEPAAK